MQISTYFHLCSPATLPTDLLCARGLFQWFSIFHWLSFLKWCVGHHQKKTAFMKLNSLCNGIGLCLHTAISIMSLGNRCIWNHTTMPQMTGIWYIQIVVVFWGLLKPHLSSGISWTHCWIKFFPGSIKSMNSTGHFTIQTGLHNKSLLFSISQNSTTTKHQVFE